MVKKNHVKFLGTILSLALLSGCASNNRNPSSFNDLNLSQIIHHVKNSAETQPFDQLTCKAIYDDAYNKLFNLAGDTTKFEMNDITLIDQTIRASFMTRLSLKELFKDHNINAECFKSVADVIRGLRYVEDYLIEMRMSSLPNSPLEYTSLKGEFPYMLVNPKYVNEFKSYEDLKSGDVIVSRGNAYSSAAIARIAANNYQFSHISFVYKDPNEEVTYTTEAHIEIGSITAPIDEHINSKNAREVVFRYQDSDVSHQASKYIYERVLASQKAKKLIDYDFGMDYEDNSSLFCSEIISSGFKYALKDADYFPMYKSKFSTNSNGMIPFLNTIGIAATKENLSSLNLFAPGDMQFDPRFELVVEWRNPKKMEENRIKDFILTKIFEKMEVESYKIDPSLKMDAKSKALWLLRRLPIVKKFVADKFPLNMSPSQMQLFMSLDKIGEAMYKEVEKASLGYERLMTPKEIYAVLDRFFKQDFETYKRYKKGQELGKPNFHLLFHP